MNKQKKSRVSDMKCGRDLECLKIFKFYKIFLFYIYSLIIKVLYFTLENKFTFYMILVFKKKSHFLDYTSGYRILNILYKSYETL